MAKLFKVFLLAILFSAVVTVPSIFAKDKSGKTERAEARGTRLQDGSSNSSDDTSSDTNSDADTEDEDESVSPTPKEARPKLIKDRIQKAREKNKEIRDDLEERASKAAERKEEKLSETRLRVCEGRSKAIGNRLKSMYKRASLIHKGHEKTYAKVDEFYNNRLVPNGYKLSNYEDLKAEIAANKANVQTLLEAATKTGTDFDCSSEDPKGQIDAFHDDMKALLEANKAYKESIHAFVKAVKDLAKTAKLEKLSVTPTSTTEEGGTE